MECTRCQGLMVEDQFFDYEGTHGFMWMKGWRCMNCGHAAADPLREANRRLHEATVLVRPSEEPEHEKAHVYRRAETVTRGPHDGGVGSTRTGLMNSVLIENNRSVSCHGDDSDHR